MKNTGAYVNPQKCDRSPFCPARRACPSKAISQPKLGLLARGPAVVDQEKCTACGTCVAMCPHHAITVRKGKQKKRA